MTDDPEWLRCSIAALDRHDAKLRQVSAQGISQHRALAHQQLPSPIRGADPGRLAGACYELRMGNVYYDLTEGGKRFALAPGQIVLIKPGHRVVLITAEELEVPPDILVRVESKGSLFSVELSPVATYADPGFGGNLGVVTQNISDKYIELPQGEPIAKADFTRLTIRAARPYLSRAKNDFSW